MSTEYPPDSDRSIVRGFRGDQAAAALEEATPTGGLTPWGTRAFLVDAAGGLYALREQMTREIGPEFTADVFYRAGVAGSERLVEFAAGNPAGVRGLEDALRLLSAAGYGRLRVEEAGGPGGEVAITAEDSAEGAMMRDRAGRSGPACDYLRGLLRGVVEALPPDGDGPVAALDCVETHCLANGDPECRFLVATPERLDQNGLGRDSAGHGSVRETLLRLNRQLEHVLEAAKRDSLTGLYNRAHFESVLRNRIEHANRRTDTLAVAMIDVDGFKEVNDGQGHAMGDLALRQVANLLAGQARETDIVARYGGDEFSWLMPGTSTEAALAVADRIRRLVSEMRLEMDLPISLSIGIASCPEDAAGMTELIDLADVAMYQSKGAGGNQVRRYSAAEDYRTFSQKRVRKTRPRLPSGTPPRQPAPKEGALRLDLED